MNGGAPAGERSGTGAPAGGTVGDGDENLFDLAERALAQGRQLHAWWLDVHRRDAYRERFEVVSTYNRPDRSFGFFDEAPVEGRLVPVMGDVEDLFYDRPKWPGRPAEAAEWIRRQVREFVMRYFLRISDFRAPSAFTHYRPPEMALPFRPLSWCPDDEPRREGFGYRQLAFRRASDGTFGTFPEGEQRAIVDLREVGPVFRWILMRVAIFDFTVKVRPFGPGTPEMRLPLEERQLVVMSPDFLCDEENPAPGVLGRYGFGYAVMRDPDRESLLAYGPGQFGVGFQTFTFEVLESGEVRLHLAFTVNRPRRLLNLSLDPRQWMGAAARFLGMGSGGPDGGSGVAGRPGAQPGSTKRGSAEPTKSSVGFDPLLAAVGALNFLTDRQAARDFCISRQQLERDMLVQHFTQNYQVVTGSLLTWRQVADWLNAEDLPRWVLTGRPQ